MGVCVRQSYCYELTVLLKGMKETGREVQRQWDIVATKKPIELGKETELRNAIASK